MKIISKIFLLALCFAAVSFAADNLSIGGRASFNYNMLWGENSPKGTNGLGFNVGGALLYEINPMISISPEITFAYREISFDLFESGFETSTSYDISFTFLNLDIPVLARLQVIQPVYFEIGPQLSLNLSASSFSETKGGGLTLETERDLEDPSLTEISLVFGVGKKLDVGTGLDINFRFMLGLTKAFEESDFFTVVSGKMMMFHLGATYWFM